MPDKERSAASGWFYSPRLPAGRSCSATWRSASGTIVRHHPKGSRIKGVYDRDDGGRGAAKGGETRRYSVAMAHATEVTDHEIKDRLAAIEYVQGSIAHLAPGRNLADELIADRRAEEARERPSDRRGSH